MKKLIFIAFSAVTLMALFTGCSTLKYIALHSAEPEMVLVRGDAFIMGGSAEQGADAPNEKKLAHWVIINSFYIGKYEVTQKQYYTISVNVRFLTWQSVYNSKRLPFFVHLLPN